MKTIKEQLKDGDGNADTEQCKDCKEQTMCRCKPVGVCKKGVDSKMIYGTWEEEDESV